MTRREILALVTVALLGANSLGGTYSGGTGEPNDPYLIYDANQMNAIGADPCNWDKHFKLMADIDLSRFTGTDFNIISYWNSDRDNEPFTGVFNGNGHTISNFICDYVPYRTSYLALFGYVGGGGEIKDLGLEDVNINVGTNAASLVGINEGTISNCYATGLVEAEYVYAVGGLVAANRGMISACYFAGSVSVVQGRDAGGLAGFNGGTVSACYAAGSVTGDHAGGLVGYASGEILDCYATGSVTGGFAAGGLVGWIAGTVSNCYATGAVNEGQHVGGLVGYNRGGGSVEDSFFDKETTGQSDGWGGMPLTSAKMHRRSTFTEAGWDFVEIWDIGENQTYPFLRTYPAGDIDHDDRVNFLDLAILAGQWLVGAE